MSGIPSETWVNGEPREGVYPSVAEAKDMAAPRTQTPSDLTDEYSPRYPLLQMRRKNRNKFQMIATYRCDGVASDLGIPSERAMTPRGHSA